MAKISFIFSQPRNLPRNVDLDLEQITLGRSASCTFPIADNFLSRTHAELVARDGKWFLRDRGSVNGTFVNGVQIDREMAVGTGDSIRLGDSELRIVDGTRGDAITQVDIEPARETSVEQIADFVLDEEQVTETAERTVIIHRLALELLGEKSMSELFETIVDHVMEVMSPSRVAIALLGEDGESLQIAEFRSRDGSDLGELTISSTLLSQIIGQRRVLSFTDIGANEFLAAAKSIVMQGIHSALCAPLLANHRVLGVLYLDYQHTTRLITEEDAQLAAQIARVAAIKLESTRLRESALEKERMDESLRVAQAIQMRMLPQEFPLRTEESLFEIAAAIRPAKQVGGDFYDFFHTEDDRLYLCIGDVSGKGMPAALLMAVTRALFRSMILQGESPARIMAAVNRQLAQESEADMFVTAFCAVLDLPTGELHYSNGGHNPPFVVGGDGVVTELSTKPGLVLGFMEGFDFVEQTHRLSPGDALYLDTDGISEATNHEGELFMVERLQKVLEQNASRGMGEIISSVIASVEGFVAGAPQSDDLTLMAIRYLKPAAGRDSFH
jgi:serine phosphatase RsbU (regulator of sigma subunit)/pSer/pThr/pTyr-binding forkhead associated (FHA) protein